MWISWLSRSEGCHTSCRWNGLSFHVKPTSCGPAVTDARGHARVDEHLRLVHVLRLHLVILGAADLRGIHLGAVDGDDERVRRVVALDAGVAFLDAADQPSRELVLAVGRKHMTDHRAAARPERQAVDVSALAELTADRVLGVPGRARRGRRRPSR